MGSYVPSGSYRDTCRGNELPFRLRLGSSLLILACAFLLVPYQSLYAQEVEVAPGITVSNPSNTGAAMTGIPLEVPPGRGGISPNLALTYNSGSGTGWVGTGWRLQLGEIQRSTANGVDYTADDYIFIKDDSSFELTPRGDWGANYYGSKIEGAFTKFYKNPTTGGWEVTTKDGVKYFYGTTNASRQINYNDNSKVFNWQLDRVQDTNSNYMTASYVTDQGITYLDRIDYTGNSGSHTLSPSNYVKFNRIGNLLKSVEVYANGQYARKYRLDYATSSITGNSLLRFVLTFGSDGADTNPAALPAIQFFYEAPAFADIISRVENGIGGITRIEYASGRSYPDCYYMLYPVPVVTKVIVDDGNNNLVETNYTYSGGRMTMWEFRGYEYVKATAASGTTTETWFYQDDVRKGIAYDTIVKDSGGNIYQRTYNTYQIGTVYTDPDTQVVIAGFPYLQRKDEYLYDGSTTYKNAATNYEYDNYGNVTRVHSWGDTAVSGDEKDDYIEYYYDTANWIVNRPNHTYTLDGSGTKKAEAWLSYFSNGNLHTKTAWLNGGSNPVITYGYDWYGNQNSVTDARNHTTTITYDSATSTYPASWTNELWQSGSATYDYRFGKPLTKTGPNGSSSSIIYTYDAFGRLTSLTDSVDGSVTKEYLYQDYGTVGYQKVITHTAANIKAAATCPAGGSYNAATNRCEASSGPTYACPFDTNSYSSSSACTSACATTVACWQGSGGISLGGTIWNACNFISTTENSFYADDAIGINGAALSGSLWGFDDTLEYRTIRFNGNNNAVISNVGGEVFVAGAVVSGSVIACQNYGDTTCSLTGVGNTITSSCGGTLTFTGSSDYICPLSGGSSCDTNHQCSKSYSCSPTGGCPSGYSLDGGTCTAPPTCPANTVINASTGLCDRINQYVSSEAYFDGLGRTIKTRTEGPDNKTIVQESVYDSTGQLHHSSLPYFEGWESALWTYFTYDPVGRVTQVQNPDGTLASKSYARGRTTFIDANNHQKIEEKDVYGRLVKVEEYTGTSNSPSLYATTTYQYDVLGNLLQVTDAQGNQTIMHYDTLSRKIDMTDPDMGYWHYTYDANGNLLTQMNGKGLITFTYDELNRVKTKNYPTGTPVNYTYDEGFSTSAIGKLTTVTDASGTEQYYYDNRGRSIKVIKTVDGVSYTTEATYDTLGRLASTKYPDGEVVNYGYDAGGNQTGAAGYANYSNFSALGQAGNVSYANGVTTTLQYYSNDKRLFSITTNSPAAGGLQNTTYAYYNDGNVHTMIDLLDMSSQIFAYDELNRLTQAQSDTYGTLSYNYDQIGNMTYNSQVGSYIYPTNHMRPHAVSQAGSNTYGYDANGNMVARSGREIVYDYDNRATTIVGVGGTVQSVYDYTGQRVKKIGPSGTTVYIGKLYECTNGVCTKYIFAGGKRVAAKSGSAVSYYHSDHLGSASIVTDGAGNKVEEVYYYPFGGIRSNSGSVNVKHKFTGQEEDPESGLYYYNARYYDPVIGRFISPDSMVGNPHNPQSLNRYSYVENNPLNYTDPTGHFKLKSFLKSFVSGLVGGAVFILTGGAAAPLLSAEFLGAATVAGAAAGGTSAALSGRNIIQGIVLGGAMGFAGGLGAGLVGPEVMLAGGAAYATAKGGLNGLAYFAGEVIGGMAGGAGADYAEKNWLSTGENQISNGHLHDIGTDGTTNIPTRRSLTVSDIDKFINNIDTMTCGTPTPGISPSKFLYDFLSSGAGQLIRELAESPLGKYIVNKLSNPGGPGLGDMKQALGEWGDALSIKYRELLNNNRGAPGRGLCVQGCHPGY